MPTCKLCNKPATGGGYCQQHQKRVDQIHARYDQGLGEYLLEEAKIREAFKRKRHAKCQREIEALRGE